MGNPTKIPSKKGGKIAGNPYEVTHMKTFFIIDDDQLVEVIEHITSIEIFTPYGLITQPRINPEFKVRGKATEEDRRRIPQALGGDA